MSVRRRRRRVRLPARQIHGARRVSALRQRRRGGRDANTPERRSRAELAVASVAAHQHFAVAGDESRVSRVTARVRDVDAVKRRYPPRRATRIARIVIAELTRVAPTPRVRRDASFARATRRRRLGRATTIGGGVRSEGGGVSGGARGVGPSSTSRAADVDAGFGDGRRGRYPDAAEDEGGGRDDVRVGSTARGDGARGLDGGEDDPGVVWMMMGMMMRAVREGSRSGARRAEGEGHGREEGGVGGGRRRGRGRRGRGQTRPRIGGVRARAAERVVRLGVHGGRRRGRGDVSFARVYRNEQRRERRDPNPGRRAPNRAARDSTRPCASSRGLERARGGPSAREECDAGGESPTRLRIFSAPERECPTDPGHRAVGQPARFGTSERNCPPPHNPPRASDARRGRLVSSLERRVGGIPRRVLRARSRTPSTARRASIFERRRPVLGS